MFKTEIVADAFVPHEEVKANKHGSAEAKKSLMERVATAQNIGRMGAATAALLASQDAKNIGIGMQIAGTVLEHNSRKTAQKYLGANGGECDEDEDDEIVNSTPKQSTRADEKVSSSQKYLGANHDTDEHFITSEKHFRAWRAKGHALEQKVHDAQAAIDRGEISALGELVAAKMHVHLNNVMRPISPPRQTKLSQRVGDLSRSTGRHVPHSVKTEASRFSSAFSECRAEIDAGWEAFKAKPSLQTWNDLALGSKVGFETVELVGTSVEKTKSLVRQGFRASGISADRAQDLVAVGGTIFDAVTLYKGAASLTGKVSVSGTNKSTTLSKASKIGTVDDIVLSRAANSNITRINTFDRMAKGNTFRAPANQTPLTHNQAQATETTSKSIPVKSNDMDYRQVYLSSKTSTAGGSLTLDGGKRTLTTSGKGSNTLLIFTKNDDGRWIQSASVNASAKDLPQRPLNLKEITARTVASWEGAKAARATTIQQHIDHVTGVDRVSTRTQLFGTDQKPITDPYLKQESLATVQRSRQSQADELTKLHENPKSATRRIDTIGNIRGNQNNMRATPSTANVENLVTRPNENPYQFTSDIFDTKRVTWTAPNGTKQTYQVTQRTDIDWNMIRTNQDGPKMFIGKTNLEAAQAEFPPQLPDGSHATLHHLEQDARGGLIEASRRYHGIDKGKIHDSIHSVYGRNKPHAEFPVNQETFRLETKHYWKERAKNIVN